jgi:hypothetical protein
MEPKHETEQKYPEQCTTYNELVAKMYLLHLDKNREYSPNNIKMLGQLGVCLRLMEKIIRTLNLLGFDALEGKLKEKINDPKFGSVEAELEDIANLAIIAQILGKGKWAK